MTTQTNEAIETLGAEIEELKRQRGQALGQVRRAETRFGELEGLRTEFSPKAFAGDEAAARELEAIEDEHDRFARSVRVARSALPEFDRMLEEARGKLAEEEREVHRERYNTLYAEADALTPRAEALAKELYEVLEKRSNLLHDASQELRHYDGDGANSLFTGIRPAIQDFIDGHFHRWLHRKVSSTGSGAWRTAGDAPSARALGRRCGRTSSWGRRSHP